MPVYIGNDAFVPTSAVTYDMFGPTGEFGDLLAVDLTNFAAPQLVDTLADPQVNPTFGGPNVILGASQAANHLLYSGSSTATGGGNQDVNGNLGVGLLDVVDVTNPAAMNELSQLAVQQTDYLQAPLIQGTIGVSLASIGPNAPAQWGGTLGIVIFDLSNRVNPAVRSFVNPNLLIGSGSGAAIIGPNLFLFAGVTDATERNLLLLVDTTTPYAPKLTTYPVPVTFNSMVVSGNYLYAATAEGFLVYSIPGGTPSVNSCPESMDVALVLDLSDVVAGANLTEIKSGVEQFLGELQFPLDRVAIIQAGTAATLIQPLTNNQATADAAIAGLATTTASYIGGAITAAQNALLGTGTNPAAGHAIIVFSDGKDAAAPTQNATALAAAAAKAAGIQIVTITYDSTATSLSALASASSGAFTAQAASMPQLVSVLDTQTAVAILQIDPQATPGPRTCTVSTGTQVVQLQNAFTVQGANAGAAPNTITLKSITPASATAGATV
ncbi:MAG: vWA domain-containing protein, partial [Bryobacteraceae bacterium]